MSAPTPAWAVPASHPCITAGCVDCKAPLGDEEYGGTWHFDSLEELLATVARYREDYDEEEGIPWQIVDGDLLCSTCTANRRCTAEGHRWVRHDGLPARGDLPPTRTYWSCARYCSAAVQYTDPRRAHLDVVEGGEAS